MNINIKNIIQYTGITSCIFLFVSLPQLYIKSNDFLLENGTCPTYKSRLLHLLIFFILTLVCLKYLTKIKKTWLELFEYILYSSLLYFLISSPDMYMLTNNLAGGSIKLTDNTCPTINGIIVHVVIYFICLSMWKNTFNKI